MPLFISSFLPSFLPISRRIYFRRNTLRRHATNRVLLLKLWKKGKGREKKKENTSHSFDRVRLADVWCVALEWQYTALLRRPFVILTEFSEIKSVYRSETRRPPRGVKSARLKTRYRARVKKCSQSYADLPGQSTRCKQRSISDGGFNKLNSTPENFPSVPVDALVV